MSLNEKKFDVYDMLEAMNWARHDTLDFVHGKTKDMGSGFDWIKNLIKEKNEKEKTRKPYIAS